jgi:hypothetical protein
MDWQKELEARLADDSRLERKKSRTLSSEAFFLDGKEVANFPRPATVSLRMTAAGIYAMGAKVADERVLEVSSDWILLRLGSEEDLTFAQDLLERIHREKRAVGRPKGKQTRRDKSGRSSKATKAFEDAQALKALKDFKNEPAE